MVMSGLKMDVQYASSAVENQIMAVPENRLICKVCEKQYSKYTCPRCNLRYCSLPCYKNHSLRCTESFNRNNVLEEMRDIQASKETQQNMMEILKRIRIDEEGRSIIDDECLDNEGMQEDGLEDGHVSIFSDKTLRLIAEGGNISLEDLSVDERKQFLRALAAGELSHLISPWNPWWLNPLAGTVSITTDGTRLIQPAYPSEDQSIQQLRTEASETAPVEVPAPHFEPLATVRQLIPGGGSPLLPVHLAEVIYSYCFTLRFCNGDWQSEPLEAAFILLSVSQVLGLASSPESIQVALAEAVKTICSPAYKHAGGFQLAVGLFDDSSAVLRLGRACVVCALADLHRMLERGLKELKAELGTEKHERRSGPGGSDENSSVSTPKQNSGSIQNSNSRTVREEGSEGKSYQDLRKMRDSKRGIYGNKSPPSVENRKSNTRSNATGNSGRHLTKSSKQSKSSVEMKKLLAAIRKVYFLMCWSNDQPREVFTSLAVLVETENERLSETAVTKTTSTRLMQDVVQPRRATVEEIVEQ